MTLHFPDQVETNMLTLDTWDPKSGTAEFKATAIRVEPASEQEIAIAAERLRSTAAERLRSTAAERPHGTEVVS